MSNCSNHKKELFGESDMKKVAESIGDLHYETLANLLENISKKLFLDAAKDSASKRNGLANFLYAAANNTHFASAQIEGAWQISKPFMEGQKPKVIIEQKYYMISLKHTSKGDTALLFWCANAQGYTYDRNKAGLYSAHELEGSVSYDNVPVRKEQVDPFWMNAVDFEDKFIAVPNNPTVLRKLGLDSKFMKPKKWRSCKMVFLNTPVINSTSSQS